MKLQELLKNIKPSVIEGNTDIEISGVNIDSRKIREGHLFVAMRGTQVDGHKFIDKALESGAKAVLCEEFPQDKKDGICYILVDSTEDAVRDIVTNCYKLSEWDKPEAYKTYDELVALLNKFDANDAVSQPIMPDVEEVKVPSVSPVASTPTNGVPSSV